MLAAEHGVHVHRLSGGGSAVIKRKANIPLVTIAVGVRGGTHAESPATAGFTALMARASIKGTQGRSAAEIAELAELMGGSVSPSVTADIADWEITVPARHFDAALELICDVAFHPALPADEFEVERKLMLSDLEQSRDDMYRYPLRLCMQQAFREHPYGTPLAALEDSVRSAERTAVAAWHAQTVRAPWAFVVGAIDPERAAEAIAMHVPATAPPETTVNGAMWGGPASDSAKRDKAQTAIALAFPGPARNNPHVYTLQVLANAVGGLGGRFFEELRSRRSLAYTVNLLPVARWLGGAFIAYIATSPDREEEARIALLEQFERLTREEISAEEVERAQRYTIGTWQIRSQTNGAQLGELLNAYLLGPGYDEIVEFEKRIRSVTPAHILEVARRYFDPARVVEGIVRGTRAPTIAHVETT